MTVHFCSRRVCAWLLIWGVSAGVCRADDFSVRSALSDTGRYFTAPLRWDVEDWSFFGVSLATIAGAHEFDGKARAHFTHGTAAALDGKDNHSLRDAAPAAVLVAGTALGAFYLRDREGYGETWSLLEAGAFSSMSGEILKFAAGRDRPNATTSPNMWRDGGSSFPSVHASAAFAIGTVFAESGGDDYRWLRRLIGYGVGVGTAYIRVKDNVHWASDTVAGMALGIGTARFVLNRQSERDSRTALEFAPAKDGWILSYQHRFQ